MKHLRLFENNEREDDFGQRLPKNIETVKLKLNAKKYNL